MLEEIKKMSPRQLYQLQSQIKGLIEEQQIARITQQIELNEQAYVGKYFRRIPQLDLSEKYYKVISAKAHNEYRLTVFVFPTIPKLTLDTKIPINDNTKKSFIWKLDSFYVDDILIESFCNNEMYEEIDEITWKKAFDAHIKGLKELI